MAMKTTKNESTYASTGAHYLILLGAIILLVAFVLALFVHAFVAAVLVLLLGVLISVIGLSRNSLHLLKKKTGKA
jgi:Flp pilus assembly protein TadB